MKKIAFFLIPVIVLSLAGLMWPKEYKPVGSVSMQRPNTSAIVGCAPDLNEGIYSDKSGKFISILAGWGNHSYPINSKSDSAQIYFNQGLSMYYSYHMKEALASFQEATRFDSGCAMLYWGQALAMGPTYNFGHAYKMPAGVAGIISLMNQNKGLASAKEKVLIDAMNRRYNVQDTADTQRKHLNVTYAEAMKNGATIYNTDLDIKALYVDAVMLVHPWDFWNNNGTPKYWTPELVQHCEDILKQDAHHPAGLHYYIHVTEASRNPQVALPSADSLIKLFPGIAHMVHMSSHEYERIGYYAKGVKANEEADESLGRYASSAAGLNLSRHSSHYYAVDAYCALSGAMYKKALTKTLNLRNIVNPAYLKTYDQYLYMFPLLAMTRMGKWKEIIADTTTIAENWSYANILNDFAKGMAYVKTGNYHNGKRRLEYLREKQKDDVLKIRFSPHSSSPYACSIVPENILDATLLFEQKKYAAALTAIKKAILAEDSLIYAEPKMWMLPARQYLGSFLMRLKKPKEAEDVYRQDLVWNPGNGWSLLGLYQALKAQGKTAEARKTRTRWANSFSEADALPVASAY